MPVTGEYTWSETNDHVEVSIPLKGVSVKKVDVFTASTLLKVNYSPFLLDLNLHKEIDEDDSRAVLKNGTLKIRLAKKSEGELWGRLCFEGSKEEIKQRRQLALKQRDEKVQRQVERAAQTKVDEERMVFQKHMELEEKERQTLDNMKATEKKKAENEVHETFAKLKNEKSNSNSTKSTRVHFEPETEQVAANYDPTTVLRTNQDAPQGGTEDCEVESEHDLPPPRKVVHNTFKHTPRLFKTPARQSTIKQEQEFIMKNRTNLKQNVLLNDVEIGEADPVWLSSKGDEFYAKGDFYSAINAYTEALGVDKTMVRTLGSRAACYLHIREGPSCIKDCLDVLQMTEAIESEFDTAEGQTQFRKDVNVRIALAYCLTEEYDTALEHFTLAQTLDETDEVDKDCIFHLKILMEATELKIKADGRFAEGALNEAIGLYSNALSIDPTLTKALMNRAACHLAMKDSAACIEDCTQAIALCKQKPRNSSLVAAILFPKPKVQRKWIATLLCRRAAAKQLDKGISGALVDLEEAKKTVRPRDDIDIEALEKSIACLKKEMAA